MSCAACFETVQHTGSPAGHTESIAGINTYIASPARPGPTNVLLYFADVFGPLYINNKLIQDCFASNGYTVLGPDYFFGDDFDSLRQQPGFDRPAWSAKAVARAQEHTPAWVDAVRLRYGTGAKYVAVGYCFGAPHVLSLATDPTFLAAAAVAHPSRLYDAATQQLKVDVFEGCVAPIAFGCAETDKAFPAHARREAEDILAKNKTRYYFQVFSGVDHGFATRGDPAVLDQRFAKEECARGFLQWFNTFTA